MYKDIVFLDGIDEDYLQSVINFVEEWESYSPVLRISTSGSTGAPKTIEFSRAQVESSARYTGQFFDFKKGDCVLLSLSPNFVAGKLMIVRAMLHEMKIVVAPLNANPLKEIENFLEPIKLAAFVPYQVNEILNDEHSRKIYETIENVIIGGAEISKELEMKVSKLKNKNYCTFAMTETLTHFALRRIDGVTDFYTCLPGITISKDERDCIIVEPNTILKDRLITNDVVELIDSTKFRWKGRIDNLINSAGIKIFPEMDEKLIEHLFNGIRFYLSSKKSATLGEEVVLIVGANFHSPVNQTAAHYQKPYLNFHSPVTQIEDFLRNEKRQQEILIEIENLLPKYHAPKSILFFDKFEETKNGKIIRQKFS